MSFDYKNVLFTVESHCRTDKSLTFLEHSVCNNVLLVFIIEPFAREGDSGGGLVFQDAETNLYYLRGIVSIRGPRDSPLTIFTDVAKYIKWISDKKKEAEKEAS